MIELIVVCLIFLLIFQIIPFLRQIDEDYTKKYEKENKWKENITQRKYWYDKTNLF